MTGKWGLLWPLRSRRRDCSCPAADPVHCARPADGPDGLCTPCRRAHTRSGL